MTDMRYYDYTKYPSIYKNSYWGNHRGRGDAPDQEIIKNRNEFITNHNVKSYKSTKIAKKKLEHIFILGDEKGNKTAMTKSIKQQFDSWVISDGCFRDHAEFYEIQNEIGKKQLMSVFSTHLSEKEVNLASQHGYIEVAPLYNLDQKTFIKIID